MTLIMFSMPYRRKKIIFAITLAYKMAADV